MSDVRHIGRIVGHLIAPVYCVDQRSRGIRNPRSALLFLPCRHVRANQRRGSIGSIFGDKAFHIGRIVNLDPPAGAGMRFEALIDSFEIAKAAQENRSLIDASGLIAIEGWDEPKVSACADCQRYEKKSATCP